MPLLLGALDELAALLGHDLRVLLAHGLSEDVSLAQREAAEFPCDTHHLFLVRNDAVGLAQDRLELRQFVLDLDLPALAGDEIIHHAAPQRAWSIQRVQRDQVFDGLRLRLPQNVPHPAALELEDAVGLRILKDLIGLRIVQRQRGDVEIDSRGAFDLLNGVEDERERAQAQEVHLQQTDALDLLHGPLCRDFVPRPLVERGVLDNGARRDHDARRMY